MFEKRIEFEITAQRSRTIAKRSRKFSPVLDHRANPKEVEATIMCVSSILLKTMGKKEFSNSCIAEALI